MTVTTSYEFQEDGNSDLTSSAVRERWASSLYLVYGRGTGLWVHRARAGNPGGDSPWSNTERVDPWALMTRRLRCACRWC